MKYHENYKKSIVHPEAFWKEQANGINWINEPKNILTEDEKGNFTWFEDGTLNMSYLCIDRHVEDGYGDQIAIIYDSPVSNRKEEISYNTLLDQVERLAGGLRKLGLKKGDTVIIYMPMIPQSIYAMLACARIGAIHSVVFGGFAPHELAIRIDDCKPKVILTASNGIEVQKYIPYKPLVDAAIKEAKHKPRFVVVYDRKQGITLEKKENDIDFEKLILHSEAVRPVAVPSNHPLYILYTSGTTGPPKGIIRDTGGYATALKYSMKSIYGVEEGETYWAASDIGWVVGHSYIVYGPLLNRNTTILFEGKPVRTPDASTFWRVASEHKVNVMFTAPTAIRAIKREDPEAILLENYDLTNLRYLFLAGERCDPPTLEWSQENLGVNVIDHWWQTESGWPMLANMVGLGLFPIKPGSAAFPVCGYDIQILNENGKECGLNESGMIVAKRPLPPGNLLGLWGDPAKCESTYFSRFPGYYLAGDAGYRDEDGYYFITGRIDDIINVAGHRLSTSEMEELVSTHPDVAECAVFGIDDDLKGQIPMGVVVLKSGASIDDETLQKEIVQIVRNGIGPVASFKKVVRTNRLPKTRSGKILRKMMRRIADHKEFRIPSTIDEVNIVDEIIEAFNQHDLIHAPK